MFCLQAEINYSLNDVIQTEMTATKAKENHDNLYKEIQKIVWL